MDQTHLHLIINHFPIILPIVGLFVIIAGLFFKSEILKRTAFFIFVVSAITAAIAFSSGEAAEHVVEKIPGVDEHFIEEHEEVAEVFIKLIYVLGVVSLLGLWANWKEKPFSKWITYAAILFSVISLYFAQETGNTGGEIRHSEIRSEISDHSSDKNHETSHENHNHK